MVHASKGPVLLPALRMCGGISGRQLLSRHLTFWLWNPMWTQAREKPPVTGPRPATLALHSGAEFSDHSCQVLG